MSGKKNEINFDWLTFKHTAVPPLEYHTKWIPSIFWMKQIYVQSYLEIENRIKLVYLYYVTSTYIPINVMLFPIDLS